MVGGVSAVGIGVDVGGIGVWAAVVVTVGRWVLVGGIVGELLGLGVIVGVLVTSAIVGTIVKGISFPGTHSSSPVSDAGVPTHEIDNS
jgi:hypothetical protein